MTGTFDRCMPFDCAPRFRPNRIRNRAYRRTPLRRDRPLDSCCREQRRLATPIHPSEVPEFGRIASSSLVRVLTKILISRRSAQSDEALDEAFNEGVTDANRDSVPAVVLCLPGALESR